MNFPYISNLHGYHTISHHIFRVSQMITTLDRSTGFHRSWFSHGWGMDDTFGVQWRSYVKSWIKKQETCRVSIRFWLKLVYIYIYIQQEYTYSYRVSIRLACLFLGKVSWLVMAGAPWQHQRPAVELLREVPWAGVGWMGGFHPEKCVGTGEIVWFSIIYSNPQKDIWKSVEFHEWEITVLFFLGVTKKRWFNMTYS